MNNMTFDWHIAPLSQLEKQFGTDLSDGLSARDARIKLEKIKKDRKGKIKSLFTSERTSLWSCICCYLFTPYVALLLVVALATAFFGSVLLGFSVFLVAFAASVIGGVLNLRAVRRLEDMGEYAGPMVRVRRGGNFFYTDGRNLVPGDLIYLNAGDLLPCDARLIKSYNLVVDELYYTGKGIGKRRISKAEDAIYQENKCRPSEAANMLFAGSAVMEGNAIALVCAVGENVILAPYISDGALGGRDSDPEGVKNIRNPLHIVTFICGCALPVLSLLGLLTLRGRAAPIYIFTLLLSAVMFLMGELLSHSAKETAVAYMNRLAVRRNKKGKDRSASVRNIKTFDTLSSVTDLVLLGKAGLSQGIWKIAQVYTASGIEKSLTPETQTGDRLLYRIHIYTKALREAGLRTSFSENGYADALSLYLRECGFDINGANLGVRSLYLATDTKYGYACAESENRIDRVALTFDDRVIGDCRHLFEGNAVRSMEDKDKQSLLLFRANAVSKGYKCLYIISELQGSPVFEGILTLYLPADAYIGETIDGLMNLNIKTMVLLSSEDGESSKLINDPALSALFKGQIALYSEFRRTNKDILTDLGAYCAYVGFDLAEYERFIEELRHRGHRIAAFGVDNNFNSIMACADVAVSCDTLPYASEQHRESVYEKMPPEGRDTNLRASQQTRLLSKVIVRRAHRNGGGISAVLNALRMSRRAYISFTQTLLLFSFLMIGLLSFNVMSVLTGSLMLDAWQTVTLSSVYALMSITLFTDAEQKSELVAQRRDFTAYPADTFRMRLPSLIARGAVAFAVAITVKILELFGIFGETPTYTLAIYICLVLTAFAEVFLINIQYTKKGEGRRFGWLKFMFSYAVLLSICAVSTQRPFADALFPNGFGTREYLIVPAYLILYIIALLTAHLIEKKRNNV